MAVNLRPTDWRDLRVLHRNRGKGLWLNTAQRLTRGGSFASGVLLSNFSTATNVFTWICSDDCGQQPILGQFAHSAELPFARLTFLAPDEALASPATVDLLEQLTRQAGDHGAFNLLAEIEEQSPAFKSLRKAGFVVYARQRIWKLKENGDIFKLEIPWETASKQNVLSAQSLFHSVVPGLVQQVEPLSTKNIHGVVCHNNGDLLGYVDLKFGPRGIWAQPFIHPDVVNVETRIKDLFESIPNRRSRPVFLCIRSYQSWLESSLDALGAEPGPRQAVMVKRLAVQHQVKRPFTLPQIDGHQEITTPVAQSQQNSGLTLCHNKKSQMI
jgi:hypothetical protein